MRRFTTTETNSEQDHHRTSKFPWSVLRHWNGETYSITHLFKISSEFQDHNSFRRFPGSTLWSIMIPVKTDVGLLTPKRDQRNWKNNSNDSSPLRPNRSPSQRLSAKTQFSDISDLTEDISSSLSHVSSVFTHVESAFESDLEDHTIATTSQHEVADKGPTLPSEIPNADVKEKRRCLFHSVSFGQVQVRSYERILDIHPSTSAGPSLGIGWKYQESSPEEIQWNKTTKTCEEFCLPRYIREDIVRKQLGYSSKEIAQAVRQNLKIKKQRRQTTNNLRTNLVPVEKVEYMVEKSRRRVGQVISRQGIKGDSWRT